MPVTITVEVENEVQAERVRQFLRYEAMSPDEQAAERARLHEAARERHLAAMTPERRAIAEKRRADALAVAGAEQERVRKLTPEERQAERAVRMRDAALAEVAKLPPQTVRKVEAAVKTVKEK